MNAILTCTMQVTKMMTWLVKYVIIQKDAFMLFKIVYKVVFY